MINIPIYRALKLNTENEYVEGVGVADNLLIQCILESYYDEYTASVVEIDPTTLSIHFPDMLDSQGNRIFASLSEDGKGGSVLKTRGNEAPCKFNKGFTIETIMGISNLYMLLDKVKVIGIQE